MSTVNVGKIDARETLRSRVTDAFNRWRTEPDPYIRYSVILYLCVFFGTIHIAISGAEQMRVAVAGPTATGYLIWQTTALVAPVLYVVQWFLRLYGKRYLGLTVRLVADILLATVLWCVWVARENAEFPYADVNIFTNYIFVGVSIFALTLIARDVWVLFFRKGT